VILNVICVEQHWLTYIENKNSCRNSVLQYGGHNFDLENRLG